VIEISPDHFKAFTQLGLLYLTKEKYDDSAESLNKAIKINKDYYLPYTVMGNLMSNTSNSEKAIKYFLNALKLNPEGHETLIGLANAYYDS